MSLSPETQLAVDAVREFRALAGSSNTQDEVDAYARRVGDLLDAEELLHDEIEARLHQDPPNGVPAEIVWLHEIATMQFYATTARRIITLLLVGPDLASPYASGQRWRQDRAQLVARLVEAWARNRP